jgi:uncharacterized protein HemX
MPGPRIYTQSWERLKLAAKEMEARESEEYLQRPAAPEKPKRRIGSKSLVLAMVLLALLTVLAGSLWIDSQARLMTATRDLTEFKTRLDLLQEKMGKVEEERQRLADENGSLSLRYEQRVAQLAQLEEELEALRSQKEKPKSKARQPVAAVENPPAKAVGAPKAVQEPPPPTPREEQGNATNLQRSERRGVKIYTVN